MEGREWYLVMFVMASSFLVSGIVFGWAPLLLGRSLSYDQVASQPFAVLREDGTTTSVGEEVLTVSYTAGVTAQVHSMIIRDPWVDPDPETFSFVELIKSNFIPDIDGTVVARGILGGSARPSKHRSSWHLVRHDWHRARWRVSWQARTADWVHLPRRGGLP